MLEAKALGEPLWIAVTALSDGIVHVWGGNFLRALEHEGLALSIASDHGLPNIAYLAAAYRAYAVLCLGRVEEGIAEMRRLRASLEHQDALALELDSYIGLAWACVLGNHTEESLRNLSRALELIEATGERCGEAQVHLVWGILLIDGDRQAAEAERHLRIAIDVARRQKAKFWELRATIPLVRILVRRGHRDAARTMLTEIYAWFTEGFDTADLKDAKALLDELRE